MKIVHIITGLDTGGAESMLLKLVKESKEFPEEHAVISLMDEGTRGKELKQYSALYCLGLRQGRFSIGAFIKLLKIVRQENPDVIQGWMPHANMAAFLVNIFLTKMLFWNIRQSLIDINQEKKFTKFIIRVGSLFSRRVETIVYNSHVSIAQHKKYGFKGRNLFIANGFELEQFKPKETNKILLIKGSLGLPEASKVIGHVARYHPMKDHMGFLKRDIDLFCVMVGKNITEKNAELMSAIKLSGAAHKFILLGEREDLNQLYNVFDFTVSSSLWGEGFPNVIGESMACGTPCIVSDVGDSKRIIGGYGFSFDVGNLSQFNRCMNSALSLNNQEYKIMSASCRDHIKNNYSIRLIYSQYIDLYKSRLSIL